MSRLTEREIARKLAEPLDEEPPAGLLDKIKSEIPPVISMGALGSSGTPGGKPPGGEVRPFPTPTPASRIPRRAQWLMAASLAVAVLGGLLSWRVVKMQPPLPTSEAVDMQTRPESADAGPTGSPSESDAESMSPPPPAKARPLSPEMEKQLGSLGYTAPGDAVLSDESAGMRDQRGAGDARRRNEAGEPVQPVEVPSALPAPMVDKEQAFETGVEGGVVGGVPGGVVGGAPGGVPGGTGRGVPSERKDDSPLRVGENRAAPAAPKQKAAAAAGTTGTTGGSAEPNDEAYGDTFYRAVETNPFVDTEEDRLSTFGLDVDTASYTVARRYLQDGNLPNPNSVRIEELVNFFDYGDAPPEREDFALRAEGAPTPFAGPEYRLLRFNVRARQIRPEDRKPAVLIFVVDISGSMDMENRLGLVKRSLELLLSRLRAGDKVGLVVYGDRARVLLEPTFDLEQVRAAVGGLRAEGSTNAEAGLTAGYDLANRYFRPEANNRILLCSDGVANVGATGPERILARIGGEARKGIELTTLGFGMGNYNDVLMEQLADKGDGRYAYVDTLDEARRVLVEELEGTLETIAKDAKVQVAFNPQVVDRWRLLGYENRDIADEKFRDDTVDAGEIGAGHGVTALYEVKLKPGATADRPVANLHLRWKSERTGRVREEEKLLRVSQMARSWDGATPALRLASVVAEFGEILRGSYWARGSSLDALARLAERVAREQRESRRGADVAELAKLIGKASRLKEP